MDEIERDPLLDNELLLFLLFFNKIELLQFRIYIFFVYLLKRPFQYPLWTKEKLIEKLLEQGCNANRIFGCLEGNEISFSVESNSRFQLLIVASSSPLNSWPIVRKASKRCKARTMMIKDTNSLIKLPLRFDPIRLIHRGLINEPSFFL